MDLEIRVLFGSIMLTIVTTNVKNTATSPFNMVDNVFAETNMLLPPGIKRGPIVNAAERIV